MFQKIFFVSLQYVNFIVFTIVLICFLVQWIPRKMKNIDWIEGERTIQEEEQRWRKYQEILKHFLLASLIFLPVNFAACWLDGLSNMQYVHIPILVGTIGCFLFFIALGIYFLMMEKKFAIRPVGPNINSVGGTVSLAVSTLYAIVLSQVVYTTVLLFV